MEDPLRGLVGLGLFLLVLSLYWTLRAAHSLERSASSGRREGRMLRRWKFGKGDRAGSGSPTSTADSALTAAGDRPLPPQPSGGGGSLWCVRLRRWPLEASFRALLSLMALVSEAAVSALNGQWPGDLPRLTLYALFALSGLVEVLHSFRLLYPAGSGQLLLALAFAAEACLYREASADNDDAAYLWPGLVLMVACAATVLLEIWQSGHQSLKLLRAYLVAWQGSWLVHAGVRQIVRSMRQEASSAAEDGSPEEAERTITVAVLCFWHAIMVFAATSLLVTLVRLGRKVFCNGNSGTTVSSRVVSWCPCASVDDFHDSFRRSPTDDFEETEPLAMHP